MTIQSVIEQKLTRTFRPAFLKVTNESYMHNVPEGSESHFKVTIVSTDFEGQALLGRHRMVNKALTEELDSIHALAIHTMTPDEYSAKAGEVADSPQCLGGGKR
ncbi:MAG: BolA family transcriptional regulator [Proteobacteria bacterium]|nr:MAG: BolA family transcriptional regulator [Pseudomonadota bacterium]